MRTHYTTTAAQAEDKRVDALEATSGYSSHRDPYFFPECLTAGALLAHVRPVAMNLNRVSIDQYESSLPAATALRECIGTDLRISCHKNQ